MKRSARQALTLAPILAAAVAASGCSRDTPMDTGPGRDQVLSLGFGEHGGGPPGSIVFSSKRDGNKEIYVMNADGSDPRRVTNNTADDYYPDLSTNGEQVVFTSKRMRGRSSSWVVKFPCSKPMESMVTTFPGSAVKVML